MHVSDFDRGRQRKAASSCFVPYSAVGAELEGFVSCIEVTVSPLRSS